MDAKPVGIFDSGVGGLTVVRSLQERLPEETLCYFGDTARVPYGTKSPETVKRYSREITQFLMSHDVKIVVVACNTVSSVALPEIADVFSGPVVGVVEPGVKAALEATRNGRIGIIGTKSTIRSEAYQKRLEAAEPSLQVFAQACPLFVPLAEEGWEQDSITLAIGQRYLEPLVREKIDVLILGCTHYPLLQSVIQQAVGEGVRLINSADEVAREVERMLLTRGLESGEKRFKHRFYASDDIEQFQRLHRRICGSGEATFTEAHSDFFNIVQKVHQFKGTLFANRIQWFDPVQNDS